MPTASSYALDCFCCNILFYHMIFNWLSPVEEYERSWEQNEELGLNDIDTSSADAAYNSTDMKMGEKTNV